jgi:hypothetical protein
MDAEMKSDEDGDGDGDGEGNGDHYIQRYYSTDADRLFLVSKLSFLLPVLFILPSTTTALHLLSKALQTSELTYIYV